MENEGIILEMRGVSRSRPAGEEPLAPVRDISLSIRPKTLNLISGDGQGGENMLLRLLGLLEAPDEGEVYFRQEGTRTLSEDVRAELRGQRFGFLFAQPFLLPSFSVVENIAMPLFKISGVGADEAQQRTQAMLEFTGMGEFGNADVSQLTHAGQQLVSLARALVNNPEILIIENVDAEMSGADLASFMELVQRANAELGTTTILTARDRELWKSADRVIELAGGTIQRDSLTEVKTGGAAA